MCVKVSSPSRLRRPSSIMLRPRVMHKTWYSLICYNMSQNIGSVGRENNNGSYFDQSQGFPKIVCRSFVRPSDVSFYTSIKDTCAPVLMFWVSSLKVGTIVVKGDFNNPMSFFVNKRKFHRNF